jgi:response regulator of citrate/malate metabolism
MGHQITCHEEVRDCVLGHVAACSSARVVASELAISVSTARRYLEQMVARGWAQRLRTMTRNCKGRYTPHVIYFINEHAKESDW